MQPGCRGRQERAQETGLQGSVIAVAIWASLRRQGGQQPGSRDGRLEDSDVCAALASHLAFRDDAPLRQGEKPAPQHLEMQRG